MVKVLLNKNKNNNNSNNSNNDNNNNNDNNDNCFNIQLLYICIYGMILIYIYEVHTISFQTFFEWAFKIVVDSWKFSMLLLYILWDDWPIFMISVSNEQLQQELEYALLNPDCHSWWISKMQSGRQDT